MSSNKKKTKASAWVRFERYLDLASDAGKIAMSMRDKPTTLDWLAVGTRALGLAGQINAERLRAKAIDPWDFFDEEKWTEIPDEFTKLVFSHVVEAEPERSTWDGTIGCTRVYLGRVGNEVIGWLQDPGGDIVDGPYLLSAREEQTMRAVGERIWKRLGTRNACYGSDGLVEDPLDVTGVIPSARMREIEARIRLFLGQDISRSYLFAGPPGTGKSMFIRHLAAHLELSSLRVELSVLAASQHANQIIGTSVETLVKLLRPDLLILDDIDRVRSSGRLLHFLEFGAREFRLVLASANCTEKMMGAALRPGRFDEVITIDRLDRAVLSALIGDDNPTLLDQMAELPVAYVVEYVKRREVLGADIAEAELHDLTKRLKLVNGQTDSGN